LGRLDKYKVELKSMKVDSAHYEIQLNNQFFEDLDATEVQKGKLTVQLTVKKTLSEVYVIDSKIEGFVIVPCDRCLDEMELSISTTDQLKVKLGEDFSDDGDIVVVPESDGYINLAWFFYEFIVLNIPMKHVHAPGKCNKGMMNKLGKHLSTSSNDESDDMPVDTPDDSIKDEGNESEEIDPRWSELQKILDNN
jgi:uncharacterized metal-binding protein YceD (DUF177 family)